MNDDKQPTGNPWMKSIAIWAGILIALAAFVMVFDGRTRATPSTGIAYSEFIAKVAEGSVKEVKISPDVISGTLSNGDAFKTYAVADPTLTARLSKANVRFQGQPEARAHKWRWKTSTRPVASRPWAVPRSSGHR